MFMFKFVKKVSIVAEDARYDMMFQKILEERNTRYDNPMVTLGQNYIRPTGQQRIIIMPTSRPNYFADYSCLSADLDNELAEEFLAMLEEEPDMNMWFCKDQLNYAAKYGKLI